MGIKGLLGKQSHGRTFEYAQDGEEMVGGLASVEVSGLLAGVHIPKAAAYLTARDLLNSLIVVSLVLIIISAICGILAFIRGCF